jgi:nitrous oxidase accessory protein NosD
MAALLTPEPVMALTRVVVQDAAQCPPDTVTNPCYVNLSDAIINAVAGDSIEIRPGIYIGNFTLNKSVSIYGNETASTFLSGNGSGTVLTVDNVTTAMSIRRLTFISATMGILVRNSSSVKITNNVFQVMGTAVQTTTASTTEVTNNTFYRGTNSIASDLTTLNIMNPMPMIITAMSK